MVTNSDIDAMGRKANTTQQVEGGAVGAIEGEEVVEVWNFSVIVVKEHSVLLSVFLFGHGRVQGLCSPVLSQRVQGCAFNGALGSLRLPPRSFCFFLFFVFCFLIIIFLNCAFIIGHFNFQLLTSQQVFLMIIIYD